MARTNTNTGGGGGGVTIGGPVTGGTPNRFLLIDGSGNVYDDARVAYTPSTGLLDINRAVTSDVIQGFQISNSFLGGASFTGAYTTDSANNTSAYNGVADISGFGSSSTVSLMVAVDANGNFQTAILSPDEFRVAVGDGTIDSNFKVSLNDVTFRYDNGIGDYNGVQADATGVMITGSGGASWYLPLGGNPGDVLTRGPLDTATWAPPTGGGSPGGIVGSIQFQNASNQFDGTSEFLYDGTSNEFTMLTQSGNTAINFEPETNYWQLGVIDSSGGPSSNPFMSLRQDENNGTWTFFGAKDVAASSLTFTGSGLDDITFVGTFNGSISPATYTATIDAIDAQVINAPVTSGTGFFQGDTVEIYAGGSGGTLLATGTVVSSSNGYPAANDTVIDTGGVVTTTADYMVVTAGTGIGTESTTAIWQYTSDSVTYDETHSGGSTTYYGLPLIAQTGTNPSSDGIRVNSGAFVGHTLGDSWTQDFSYVYGNMFTMNRNTRNFILGNPTFGNRTSIDSNDAQGRIRIFADNVQLGKTGPSNSQGSIGASAITFQNDSLFEFTTTSGSGQNPYFSINISGGLYGIGDLNAVLNGTNIKIDDINQKVTITNVPAYADDATAIGAGLTTGDVYKTTTSGSTFLKIVP